MPITQRLRLLTTRYGTYIAVILAILGVASIAAAATTYANPPTSTETYVTNEQGVSARVDTSVTVSNNTSLYDEGERLENMPAYFFAASPNLTYHVRVSTPQNVETTVKTRLVLQLRGTRNGEPFWQRQQLLATETTTSTGTTWTNTTVNMSEVQALISEKRAAIGSVGTLSATHQLNVSYETDAFSGTLTAQAPLVTTARAYWVNGPLETSRTHTETATRMFTGSPNVTRIVVLAFLGTLLFAVAGSVAVQSRAYDIDEIKEQIAREQYDEWISNGEIPTKSEKEYIRVDSIEDVVDIAIDSNKRVIYDASLDVYAVVEGDLVYFYTTDAEGVSDWLDL